MKALLSNSSEKKKQQSKHAFFPQTHQPRLNNSNVFDNKYLYEKQSMRELESADHDHPLKSDLNSVEKEEGDCSADLQEVTKDLESVALDWKTLRNITECGCSTPFDHFSRKVIKKY